MTAARDGISSDHLGAVSRELALLVRRARVVEREMSSQVHPAVEAGAFGLLARLVEVGASRPSELAAHFGVGKPTIGRQLTCLEEAGLIERTPDPDDGRAHLLDLTVGGRGLMQVQRRQRQALLRERFDGLEDAEVAELARALHQLNDLLA
jgi:DNA-binding MarR family transcriptional regulator